MAAKAHIKYQGLPNISPQETFQGKLFTFSLHSDLLAGQQNRVSGRWQKDKTDSSPEKDTRQNTVHGSQGKHTS